TAEARQQTLRATVQWSHNLLTDQEQVVFRRLSVFRGGRRGAAPGEGSAPPAGPPAQVIGLLAALVDRSLVVADHQEAVRFRMLETLRHYAAERLWEAGEHDRAAR